VKTIKVCVFAIALLSLATFQGCGSSDPTSVVTMQKVAGTYYRVDINMAGASHYEIGRQYALQIKNNVPGYETRIDSFLQFMIGLMQDAQRHVVPPISPVIAFADLNARAHDLYPNIPQEYQQEIQGMQSVFSYATDRIGDGRLSPNKLLVFELFGDIGRVNSCSASAAFGEGTVSGKTILGRSLEWKAGTNKYISAIHSVLILHNGSKSLVSFNALGGLAAISAFSSNKVFGAALDSEIYEEYPSTKGKRSYMMDLRYALETATSLQDVANYLTGKDYAFNFNIFLADENSAAVFEDNTTEPFSGLRTATSALKLDIPDWDHPTAIATVNCFMLPGSADNCDLWDGNMPRWESFISRYEDELAQGKINIDVMKRITAYPGPKSDGKAVDGAIFRYDEEPALQTIIVDMDSMETWVFFQPEGTPLTQPNYLQVFSGNPF